MIDVKSLKFETEDSFLHGDILVATIEDEQGSFLKASQHPDTGRWRVFFFVPAGTNMPSWSHEADCLGVVPQVFIDGRMGLALDLANMMAKTGQEAAHLFNRALLEVEGQMELPF